ncbi:MAG: MFS transporter [Armatimonadetes bacterium]|nr:MFS transporter [Armatimonadota bacterium]
MGRPLLLHSRFRGLFWTQALGAFNDNFFKTSVVFLAVFQGATVAGMNEKELSLLAGALLLLPFVLFSATAGQLGDKYDKSRLIVRLKQVEVGLSLVAAVGLITVNVVLLLGVIFCLGAQAAFFGPLKYGILPQLLDEDELVGGNALVETGTKLAILLGSMSGGLLILRPDGPYVVSAGVMLMAVLGLLAARTVPAVPPADPGLEVRWNPLPPTLAIYRITRRNRAVFLSILGISWFWLIGAAFMSLFPAYCKQVLLADERVATMLNAIFSIGVGLGAILCGRFSYKRLELGLVPFGSIGISIFCLDLFLLGEPWAGTGAGAGVSLIPLPAPLTVAEFVVTAMGLRVLIDLLMLALFSGFFIIPLYTMIQQRTENRYRSRVVAGNNVVNSLFGVVGLLALMTIGKMGLSIPQTFGALALVNAMVALYIYGLIPEFFLRFMAYLLAHGVYRLEMRGEDHLPREGPALLVCNHVSFIDWLIIAAGVRRPVRFVMWHGYARIPLLHFLFRDAGVIPIGSARDEPEVLAAAYDRVAYYLENGELVCIFPEGKITSDGKLAPFRKGIEQMVERTPVPVVPMALRGLWGGLFSRQPGSRLSRFLRELRARIELRCGEALPPEAVTAERLQQEVERLLV